MQNNSKVRCQCILLLILDTMFTYIASSICSLTSATSEDTPEVDATLSAVTANLEVPHLGAWPTLANAAVGLISTNNTTPRKRRACIIDHWQRSTSTIVFAFVHLCGFGFASTTNCKCTPSVNDRRKFISYFASLCRVILVWIPMAALQLGQLYKRHSPPQQH